MATLSTRARQVSLVIIVKSLSEITTFIAIKERPSTDLATLNYQTGIDYLVAMAGILPIPGLHEKLQHFNISKHELSIQN